MNEAELLDAQLLADIDTLNAAIDLVLDDLTESNAHTIAGLLEWHYRNKYDESKGLAAYKAAQWELFGTR